MLNTSWKHSQSPTDRLVGSTALYMTSRAVKCADPSFNLSNRTTGTQNLGGTCLKNLTSCRSECFIHRTQQTLKVFLRTVFDDVALLCPTHGFLNRRRMVGSLNRCSQRQRSATEKDTAPQLSSIPERTRAKRGSCFVCVVLSLSDFIIRLEGLEVNIVNDSVILT